MAGGKMWLLCAWSSTKATTIMSSGRKKRGNLHWINTQTDRMCENFCYNSTDTPCILGLEEAQLWNEVHVDKMWAAGEGRWAAALKLYRRYFVTSVGIDLFGPNGLDHVINWGNLPGTSACVTYRWFANVLGGPVFFSGARCAVTMETTGGYWLLPRNGPA